MRITTNSIIAGPHRLTLVVPVKIEIFKKIQKRYMKETLHPKKNCFNCRALSDLMWQPRGSTDKIMNIVIYKLIVVLG